MVYFDYDIKMLILNFRHHNQKGVKKALPKVAAFLTPLSYIKSNIYF